MGNLEYNVDQLDNQNNALPRDIQQAAEEVLRAAEAAGHHIAAVSWFNPASTPEHHVPGFPRQGGVAVDFMVYGNKETQDWLDAYLWENRERLGIRWIISRQRIRNVRHSGSWEHYVGAGHYDHTHANFGALAGRDGYHDCENQPYVPPKNRPLVVDPAGSYPRPSDEIIYLDKITPGQADSDSVYWLQRLLREANFTAARKTGNYDEATTSAVKALQADLGDPVTGDITDAQVKRLRGMGKTSVSVRDHS